VHALNDVQLQYQYWCLTLCDFIIEEGHNVLFTNEGIQLQWLHVF